MFNKILFKIMDGYWSTFLLIYLSNDIFFLIGIIEYWIVDILITYNHIEWIFDIKYSWPSFGNDPKLTLYFAGIKKANISEMVFDNIH